ncbi:MAG: EpsI family protein [Acidobacteriia bacterium]|nr:EpsI family protein [Terriglobia bacterium]
MRQNQVRFWVVLALLVGTALFLRSRSHAENLPARQALASFPARVADWTSRGDILISDDIRKILGEGDFMQRVYARSPGEPPIEFFLAYFPSQRTGSSFHSPKNCLPGSGWEPVESSHIPLRRADGQVVLVNRYILQRGSNRLFVLYWYQSQGRAVASEYWAKFYQVMDAIGKNRTDGALVRVSTPQALGESVESSQKRAMAYAEEIVPILPQFIPE